MRAGSETPAKVEGANDFAAVVGAFLRYPGKQHAKPRPPVAPARGPGSGTLDASVTEHGRSGAEHDQRRCSADERPRPAAVAAFPAHAGDGSETVHGTAGSFRTAAAGEADVHLVVVA